MKWQALHVPDGQEHHQNAGAGHAFFNQMSRLVRSDRRRFTVATTVDFTNIFNHSDLHRQGLKLLADFQENSLFAAASNASQLMLGKCVDDFDAWQISR